jgi:hypothetical protein
MLRVAGFAILALNSILILLFAADYTRKARVSGWVLMRPGR